MRTGSAIVTGGLVASMLFGFLTQLAPSYTSVHHIGKLVLDTLAILFLAWSAWRVRRRARGSHGGTRVMVPAGHHA